jgi:hypothetical protein
VDAGSLPTIGREALEIFGDGKSHSPQRPASYRSGRDRRSWASTEPGRSLRVKIRIPKSPRLGAFKYVCARNLQASGLCFRPLPTKDGLRRCRRLKV